MAKVHVWRELMKPPLSAAAELAWETGKSQEMDVIITNFWAYNSVI